MFIVSGLLLAGFLWWLGVDTNVSLLTLAIAGVLQAVPRRFTLGETKSNSREDTERWMRQEGYLPKTKAEREQDVEAERVAAARWHEPPEGTYYDASWNLRDIETDRLV